MSKFHSSIRWQRIRNRYIKAHPLCVQCLKRGIANAGDPLTPNHVDHIDPRPLDAPIGIWDRDENLQTLCHLHHSQKTSAEQNGKLQKGCDENGDPLDKNSPWYGDDAV